MKKNISESVRSRLLNLAKSEGSDFNSVLTRYALERFLYRISVSSYANAFLLKGALLFALWYDMPHRPTRDIDLLGLGEDDLETVRQIFHEISLLPFHDGINFDHSNVIVEKIRKNTGYTGARVIISGELAKARCKIQIDIGFGDAVTPGPIDAIYPVLINDFPAPQIRTYPIYTVIAEKLHAIVLLGMTNSRLKDYLDLEILLSNELLNPNTLAHAIIATFKRRGMPLPSSRPIGLSDEFANDISRQSIWKVFLRKNGLEVKPLLGIITALRAHLEPALNNATLIANNSNQKNIFANSNYVSELTKIEP